MLISLALFVAGLAIGHSFRVNALVAASLLVAMFYVGWWSVYGTTHLLGLVVLFALLTSLQGGYLFGAYWATREN